MAIFTCHLVCSCSHKLASHSQCAACGAMNTMLQKLLRVSSMLWRLYYKQLRELQRQRDSGETLFDEIVPLIIALHQDVEPK